MSKKNCQSKKSNDLEVFCYESEDGEVCLEFGDAAVSFSKKRFIEFADKLNEVRQQVLKEYLLQQKNSQFFTVNSTYHI